MLLGRNKRGGLQVVLGVAVAEGLVVDRVGAARDEVRRCVPARYWDRLPLTIGVALSDTFSNAGSLLDTGDLEHGRRV